jgi:valyl-tRNA synthetase
MWNATRFVLTQLANTSFAPDSLQRDSYECLSLVDQWILSKLSAAVQHCNHGLETFDFFEATSAIYNFFLYEFCDVYVEFSKSVFYKKYSNLSDAEYQVHKLSHKLYHTSSITQALSHKLINTYSLMQIDEDNSNTTHPVHMPRDFIQTAASLHALHL